MQAKKRSGVKHLIWWKKKSHLPTILYPEKFSFKSEGKVKTSSDKQKSRKFVPSGPCLARMLKEVL